jgi:hypothetical protein
MIANFFVLSPRGDTIIAKQYRVDHRLGDREIGAHERSHTEALFRRIKFWDDTYNNPSVATSDGALSMNASAAAGIASSANTGTTMLDVHQSSGGGGGLSTDDAEFHEHNGMQSHHGVNGNAINGHRHVGGGTDGNAMLTKRHKGDAPPVLLMPDGLTYFHVKRNGLIFAASSARNVSANTVIEV